MDKKLMFHYLRNPCNPFGHEASILREARLQAADELERLYLLEERINQHIKILDTLKNEFEAYSV